MSNLFDLQDARVGKLLVKSREPSAKNGDARWLCECDCGNTRIVRGKFLKSGTIDCCTQCNYEDFTGSHVGKLEVIKRIEDKIAKNGQRVIQWLCKCECGEVVVRVSAHLRRGNCCCLKCKKSHDAINNFRGCGEMSGIYWASVQNSAKKRGKEFSITKEYAWKLFVKQNKRCAISGIELKFANNKQEQIHGATTASIDRIDSKKGYVKGNIQWVHKWVNRMKSNLDYEELLYYCTQIVNNDRERNENKMSVQVPRR